MFAEVKAVLGAIIDMISAEAREGRLGNERENMS